MSTIQQRRWCLFTSAGDHNAIRLWLKGAAPQWDLVVAYYGDDEHEFAEISKSAFHAFRGKGGKFQILKTFVAQNPGFFDPYSYVWVCDDDIRISPAQIDEAFAISERCGFWVAQPSVLLEGKCSYPITIYADPRYDYRAVNFVEEAAPIFRRDKLIDFLIAFDGSITGYGVDYWYMNFFGAHKLGRFRNFFSANELGRFAIIDKVQTINPHDETKGGRELDRLQPEVLRVAAWVKAMARHGLVEFPPRVFASRRMPSDSDANAAVTSHDVVRQITARMARKLATKFAGWKMAGWNALTDYRFALSGPHRGREAIQAGMPAKEQHRWCLFTSAGDHNAVRLWLKGGTPPQWDLVVAYYGDDEREFAEIGKLARQAFRHKGGKFQNLKKFAAQNPGFFDQYSYVWVCDDDIQMSAAQIEEAFAIAETLKVWVAQPALLPEGKYSHKVTCYAGPAVDYRIVNFIEVGLGIFRRDKLIAFLRAFDGSLTGYGIDYWYMNFFAANKLGRFRNFFKTREGRFAIIDKVQVLNPHDTAKGGCEIDRLQPALRRHAAWIAAKARHRLVEFPHRVFACRKLPPGRDATTAVTRYEAAPMPQPRTLAERLGYEPDARLLIVHADDFGFANAVNTAVIAGLETGLINSASVMVTCPWFPQAAAYARAQPQADLGLHLTLTSERTSYRWGPAAPRNKVPSLVDPQGYLHRLWAGGPAINAREVEIELRAQIEKAYAAGLRPTHLDSHQYRLQMSGRRLFEVYLRLGRDYGLPVFVTRDWFAQYPYLPLALTARDVVIDRSITISPEVTPGLWPAYYRRAVEGLQPGVTQFVIHPGLDDAELQALCADRATWGAAWRQRDFDFFTGDEFRGLLTKHNIKLITWREIATRFRQHDGAMQRTNGPQAK